MEGKFEKVRDCTGTHHHKFPGKEPKIIVSYTLSLSLSHTQTHTHISCSKPCIKCE